MPVPQCARFPPEIFMDTEPTAIFNVTKSKGYAASLPYNKNVRRFHTSPEITMRILIYKRTHNGDPDANGCFGAYDCMGSVRELTFDAVIGIGGIGGEAHANGIAGKLNWIGIGPSKLDNPSKRGPEVTFDHFLYYGGSGPDFRSVAPTLAKRIYGRNVRVMLHGFTPAEHTEAMKIVQRATRSGPSPKRSLSTQPNSKSCKPKRLIMRCSAPFHPPAQAAPRSAVAELGVVSPHSKPLL